MGLIVLCLLLGLIPATIAYKKGKNFALWWLYGALLFIVALPHAILVKRDRAAIEQRALANGMVKCPHCAELIQPDAAVCKHCGRETGAAATRLRDKETPIGQSANSPNVPAPTRKKPRRKKKNAAEQAFESIGQLVVVGLLSGIAIWFFVHNPSSSSPSSSSPSSSSSSSSTTKETPAQARAKAARCRHDLQCWAEQSLPEATVYCTSAVEHQASYNSKWVDGLFDSKLSGYRWADKRKGTITYVGDQVEFENGFGAWVRMSYACTYDPTAKRVTDIKMMQGRLPTN